MYGTSLPCGRTVGATGNFVLEKSSDSTSTTTESPHASSALVQGIKINSPELPSGTWETTQFPDAVFLLSSTAGVLRNESVVRPGRPT